MADLRAAAAEGLAVVRSSPLHVGGRHHLRRLAELVAPLDRAHPQHRGSSSGGSPSPPGSGRPCRRTTSRCSTSSPHAVDEMSGRAGGAAGPESARPAPARRSRSGPATPRAADPVRRGRAGPDPVDRGRPAGARRPRATGDRRHGSGAADPGPGSLSRTALGPPDRQGTEGGTSVISPQRKELACSTRGTTYVGRA